MATPDTVSGPDTSPDLSQTSSAQSAGMLIEEQHLSYSPPRPVIADVVPPKRRTRQRLLRGLSRISSTPSLDHAGRARSSSTPDTRSGASLSCVSLAGAPSPFIPSPSSGAGHGISPLASPAIGVSESDYTFTSPPSSSPAIPFPYLPHSASCNAIRKIDLPAGSCAGSVATVGLPVDMVRTMSLPLMAPRPRKSFVQLWSLLPHEIKVYMLSFFQPKELVRISRVNREFHKLCFDGQLWTSFDASEFYQDIPATSLANIIVAAGPFVKDLNLRGCIQIDVYQDALLMSSACSNLVNATLEGSLLNFHNLDSLLKRNTKLAHINLAGLTSVSMESCNTLATYCTQLEVLNLSWCKKVTARGVRTVLEACPKLRDLRVGEIRGFDDLDVAHAFFRLNQLERLILSGCQDLSDAALRTMVHGIDPAIDLLTDRPIVPPRRLRHLDLSRCSGLTNTGVSALGYAVPELEGFVLGGCSAITDTALEPILASTPRLTYLDLEDLTAITNNLLSNHLAKAPCAARLTHLSVGYCDNIGDDGVLPVLRACKELRSMDLDNTCISDLTLAEAATMVRARASRMPSRGARPYTGLSMAVYDCPSVTWTGIREVLSRNAEILAPQPGAANGNAPGRGAGNALISPTYPTEIIALKCFYGWQMTVDEHTKRVLRGDFASAARLERKWADYMQADAEAIMDGAGGRRRRRRAREAQQIHADEEEGGGRNANGAFAGAQGGVGSIGRRRARSIACAIM